MKKSLIYIIGVAMLSACSEDLQPVMPDNYYDAVQFAVGEVRTGETASRAEGDAIHTVTYLASKHPDKLGVVACFGAEKQVVTTSATTTNGKWSSDLYWPTISDKTSIDFIGYMENGSLHEATVTKTGEGKYKLEFTVSLEHPVLVQTVEAGNGKSKSVDKAPLVCCEPVHTTGPVSQAITFKMDRVLTGYSVWFQLGDRMDNLRDFVVKEVSVYGKAPASAKATVEYGAAAHSKTITWSNYDTAISFGTDEDPLKLVWKDQSDKDKSLTLNNNTTQHVKWGDATPSSGAFFAIPSESFNPTIRVKYDVVLNGTDNNVVTRQGVVSTIVLNKTNFPSLATGQPGKINPIKIKIVPSYLYVLADKDQASGYIVLQ